MKISVTAPRAGGGTCRGTKNLCGDGAGSVEEIDEHIVGATCLAMKRALVEHLGWWWTLATGGEIIAGII